MTAGSEQKSTEGTPESGRSRDPLVGTTLDGRYQIEEVLGSGGMSIVYKATQLAVNRHVAIKTLRVQLDTKPVYRERFQREISLLCALTHPNIVTVYDCVIGADDQPYVVMDYLRGKSLEALIQHDGPLKADRFARIAVQVCSALDHAHRKGVIHRDLKPGNIVMLDDEMDFIKVVDFGLAKLNQDNRKLTQSGELWGSPPYMSPEQCKGKPEDERSDLYSFGAVMYEMLTGKDPFHYATTIFELIQTHVSTQPPRLSEAFPTIDIPAKLEEVIFKAMAKEPQDRFQSAAELRDALVETFSGSNSRDSGDLFLLAEQSKTKSASGDQATPRPNAVPAQESAATPSDMFRKALDPMQGMGISGLFEGTDQPSCQSSTSGSNNSNAASTSTGQDRSGLAAGGEKSSGHENRGPSYDPETLRKIGTPANEAGGRTNLRTYENELASPSKSKSLVTPGRILIVVAIAIGIIVFNQSHIFSPRVTPAEDAHRDLPASQSNSDTSIHAPVSPPHSDEQARPGTVQVKPSGEQTGKQSMPPDPVRTVNTPSESHASAAVSPHEVAKKPPPKAHISMPAKRMGTVHSQADHKHAAAAVKPAHPTSSGKNPWAVLDGMRGTK